MSGYERLPKPILEFDNVSIINPHKHRITAVAALPNSEAILYITEKITGVYPRYIHSVIKINIKGEVSRNITPRVYDPHSNTTCGGLLILGDMLYVIQKNSSVESLSLSQFESGSIEQKDVTNHVYHIPDVKTMMNYASLFHDPSMIPDKDLLLIADQTKHEVFTYRMSTKQKEVHVRRLRNSKSVSYIFDGNKIFYLVCGVREVRMYNSTWGLVRKIGTTGSSKEKLEMPTSAIILPDGNVIISDFWENRLSEFSVDGRFIDILVTRLDFSPAYLSFSYPYLWVLGKENKLHRYKLYRNKL